MGRGYVDLLVIKANYRFGELQRFCDTDKVGQVG